MSDHLYISGESRRCAEQLVETARREECPVSAVQATRENMLPYYGTVGGRSLGGDPPLYVIDNVLEKPSPTEAEQKLLVPGLRAGHYLCLFGMHVLTPTVMEILGKHVEAQREGPVMLSPALAELAARERYLAVQLNGSRYNIGDEIRNAVDPAGLGPGGNGSRRDPHPAGGTSGGGRTAEDRVRRMPWVARGAAGRSGAGAGTAASLPRRFTDPVRIQQPQRVPEPCLANSWRRLPATTPPPGTVRWIRCAAALGCRPAVGLRPARSVPADERPISTIACGPCSS